MLVDDGLKQRLVGALVLIALAVIFLPSLFKREHRVAIDSASLIPPSPDLRPAVIAEPIRSEGISVAPPPDQAFQPKEELSLSHNIADIPESKGLDERGIPQAWTVQVASLTEPQRAKTLQDKLVATGYDAYLRVLKTEKGEITRVFIGPQIDRQIASEIKKKVDKELSVNSLVLSFTP
jgi:DedD protein